MKQFGKILKFELRYFFKNKIFVGITIFLVLLIALVMFIPRLAALDGDSEESVTELPVMLVTVGDNVQADIVQAVFQESFTEYEVKVTDKSIAEIQRKVEAEEVECAFEIGDYTCFTYHVNNISMYDNNTQIAAEALKKIYQLDVMINSGMTLEEAAQVMNANVTCEVMVLGKDQTENFFYTYIMIFALYMVILLYGQMVATNVATEKSSRAMELLITSANPTSMMFGKVIASCLAGLLQIVTVFGSAVVFYAINKPYWKGNAIIESIFDIPPELLAYMLLFFVLGFLIYAFLFGAVGSTASKLEDINTSVMPVTIIFIIGFVVVMTTMGSGEMDNLILKICSYIPFTSPMAMFTRIAMTSVAWYEIAISVAILVLSVFGIGVLAAKIYRMGVLMYGTPPKMKEIIKAIRKA